MGLAHKLEGFVTAAARLHQLIDRYRLLNLETRFPEFLLRVEAALLKVGTATAHGPMPQVAMLPKF
jgi:hypothetical protein